ncbi:MAG: hypothetical protein L6Q99_03855 [Planctomycetes bacterium]|nr:hypothetical protein [Planctomycetota bacterium]
MKPFLIASLVLPSLVSESALAQCTTRVSVDSHGVAANWYSGQSVVSRDGRFVAFESFAWNLAPKDRNNDYDVFVHDRVTGETTCVSLDVEGEPGDGQSQGPTFSADARWVAFSSTATDLVAGDVNQKSDVFVHDRVTGTTKLVSFGVGGVTANGDSASPTLSGNGRYVVFASGATNLVGVDPGPWFDVFAHDLQTGITVPVSVSFDGQATNGNSSFPVVSDDGRYVAFQSSARNLVPNDADGWDDVYVRDLVTGTTQLASVASNGQKGNYASTAPSLSGDGTRIAFVSLANNLDPRDTNNGMDAYWRDLVAGTTEVVDLDSNGVLANAPAMTIALSSDGRYALFSSEATNLWPLDTDTALDAFVRDLDGGTTQLVSVKADGSQANKWCGGASIAEFGRAVTFKSQGQLVPDKTNNLTDVFVRDFHCDVTNYCTSKFNSQFCQPTLSTVGGPTLGGFDHFRVRAVDLLPQKTGLLVWSRMRAETPFLGGWLCVAAPFVRTTARLADGDPAVDCSGTLEFPLSPSYLAAQGLTAGTEIFVQVWSRDPGFAKPDDIGLTDALRLVIGP